MAERKQSIFFPRDRGERAGRLCAIGLLAAAAMACGGDVEGPSPTDAPAPSASTTPRASPPPPPPKTGFPAPAPQAEAQPLPTQEQLDGMRARVQQNPSDRAERRRLAIALFAARQREAAVGEFETLAEGSNDSGALIDLANAYGFVSRWDEAVVTYRKVLKVQPENATALFNLAEIAFLRGDTDQAIDLYRRSLKKRPDYQRAHQQLARALEHKGDYREAYKTYAQVLESSPATPEELLAYDDALYRMASLDIKMGALDRAEQMLLALIEANPNHSSAHYAYGQLLLQQGRLEEAQQQLQTHMTLLAAAPLTTHVATGE